MIDTTVSGVYSLVNTATDDYYIGSSNRLVRRHNKHIQDLRGGYHRNPHLQRAWQKYGEAAFTFHIIAWVPEYRMRVLEQTLLDRYVNDPKCYNIAKSVDVVNPRTGMRSLEERMRTSETIRGRPLTDEEREVWRQFPDGGYAEAVADMKRQARREEKCAGMIRRRVVDAMNTQLAQAFQHKEVVNKSTGEVVSASSIHELADKLELNYEAFKHLFNPKTGKHSLHGWCVHNGP